MSRGCCSNAVESQVRLYFNSLHMYAIILFIFVQFYCCMLQGLLLRVRFQINLIESNIKSLILEAIFFRIVGFVIQATTLFVILRIEKESGNT